MTLAGLALQSTATDYDLLAELAANGGRVLTHDDRPWRVWGRGTRVPRGRHTPT